MNITPLDLAGTPFASVRFTICSVTPEQAAEWLKRNTKNRKVKSETVKSYSNDIRNGAWLLTHQGIAFDVTGRLIDGQHRLIAIVDAKRPVTLLISTGWPVAAGKNKTMDAVDRGCQRTIADQLGLQHDLVDAKRVTHLANHIGAICLGTARCEKSSTATVLEICGLFKTEITWALAHPLKTPGVKQAGVLASIALLSSAFPKPAELIAQRLETGAGLNAGDPLLLLRNWLTTSGAREYPATVRNTTLHHCFEFIQGRTLKRLDNDTNAGLLQVLHLHKDRARQVCALYATKLPELVSDSAAASTIAPAGQAVSPTSAAALERVKTLGKVFSTRDLSARLDEGENAGLWLSLWKRVGWIEPCGLEWRKTDQFGKA